MLAAGVMAGSEGCGPHPRAQAAYPGTDIVTWRLQTHVAVRGETNVNCLRPRPRQNFAHLSDPCLSRLSFRHGLRLSFAHCLAVRALHQYLFVSLYGSQKTGSTSCRSNIAVVCLRIPFESSPAAPRQRLIAPTRGILVRALRHCYQSSALMNMSVQIPARTCC